MHGIWYDYLKLKYGESQIMLNGHKQLYSLHKNRRNLLILQKMLQQDLILQIVNQKDHYLKEKK